MAGGAEIKNGHRKWSSNRAKQTGMVNMPIIGHQHNTAIPDCWSHA
jgi:hypothetical protein